MESEAASMLSNSLAFILKVFWGHLGQGFHGGIQRGWSGDDFPGAFALDHALGQAFLAGRGEQASVQFAELTFASIIGARQAGDIVSVEQTWGIVAGGMVDGLVESGQRRFILALHADRFEVVKEFLSHLVSRMYGAVLGARM